MLFVLLLFFALTALAAPFDPLLDLDTIKNLSATNRCSSSQDWQAYAFLVEDCFTAIQRVYLEQVLQKPDEIYEFIAPGSYPQTRKPWVRTPMQYTTNSCTLSIVMLNWFGPREPLPGRGPRGYEPSDTATFKDIYGAARVVERDCLLPTRRPGWDVVGAKSSIGVFLWATDSVINDRVTGQESLIHSSPNPPSPNASSSSNNANNIDSTE